MHVSIEMLAELARVREKGVADVSGSQVLEDLGFGRGRQAWYTVLLHQTLAYVEESVPFYRDLFSRHRTSACNFQRLSDLAHFPVTKKADVDGNLEAFLSEAARPETIHCTSGTTARRLHVYGNREEERALSLLSRVSRSAESPEKLALRVVPGPRRLYSPSHPGLGAVAIVVGYSTNQDNHQWYDYTDYLAEVLNASYAFPKYTPRIGVVHITPPWMLEFITRRFVDRGINPSDFGIELIGISGGFSTSRHKHLISNIWKAEHTSSYSCSEVATGEALELPTSPGVYCPGPTMYCEVVDDTTYEPVQPGEQGIVLVTSLYPFQQAMPFIRYNTGDIAELVSLSDAEGGAQSVLTAFRPVGRTGDCIRLGPRRNIGTRHVLEAIASIDEIPQVPSPRYHLGLDSTTGSKVLRLAVETVEMSSKRRADVRSNLSHRFQSELQRSLGTLSCEFALECELVSKGQLREYRPFMPDR